MVKSQRNRRTQKRQQSPMVSIVIVNWNGLRWLGRCLDSLIVQGYDNYEIILVDNASTDDSVAFVKNHYSEKVRIVRSKRNLGFAGGNNLGIAAAQGELTLLLNNDTWVEDNFLEGFIAAYTRSQYDVITAQEATYDDKKVHAGSMTIDMLGHPVVDPEERRPDFYLQGACLLFSKQLYEETRGLDDGFFMYFEETDWFWRLQLLGKTLGRDKSTLFYHAGAGSAGGGLKRQTFLWRNQNTLQMLLKNYAGYNLAWVLPLYLVQNMLEALALLLLMKPAIAYTYIEGIAFNIKNLSKILKKRQWIQQHRIRGDRFILRQMFHGPGKLVHALRFVRHEY